MVQDIPSHVGNSVDHRPKLGGNAIAHEVAIVPGTRLHRLLGVETLAVNSLHHQACLVPGRGLVVAALVPPTASSRRSNCPTIPSLSESNGIRST